MLSGVPAFFAEVGEGVLGAGCVVLFSGELEKALGQPGLMYVSEMLSIG